MTTKETFGELVKRHRDRLGLTQEELAEHTNMSVRMIQKIEKGETQKSHQSTIQRLVIALQLEAPERSLECTEFKEAAARQRLQAISSSQSIPPQPEEFLNSEALTTQPKGVVRRSLFPLFLLGIGFLILAIAGGIFLVVRDKQMSEVGAVNLVGPSDQLVTMETADRTISSGDTIRVNEVVTVTFVIINNDTHLIRIKALVIGAQGPGAHKADWAAPDVPFPLAKNIVLQPGERYEYRQSRAFYQPGDYFVEPVVEDAAGKWGGIEPFTRIEFCVDSCPTE